MSGKLIEIRDDEEECGITVKGGKTKRLSELKRGDFTPQAGLGCANQIILNAIARNEKNRIYRKKLKKQGDVI